MSMYRQLWLAIIISTLLALAGSLLASTLAARSYLSQQLTLKNADNATALALALSQKQPDAVELELAAAALFDGGHYELVRITDPAGKIIVERAAPAGEFDAPAWFVRRFPITAAPGEAQISNGWNQVGTVHLVSHSRFAYRALWSSTLEMIAALALAGVVGGYLGSLVLRRLRRPLDAVIGQAQAISERRFVTIEEPEVPELKRLASAMNTTVTRLKRMFEEEAARLETVRKEANCDALTGLANRSYFMARLRDVTQGEDSTGGAVFIVRLANLAAVNQTLGREATDELLRRFGTVISNIAENQHDALAARLNGADFALLVAGMSSPQATAEDLLDQLMREAAVFLPDQPSTWLGCGHFPRGIEIGAVLSQVDAALAAVESEGRDGLRLVNMHDGDDAPRSADEWMKLIERALDQRWVRLVSFPVTGLDGRLLHRECPLRLMFDSDGEWQPAGRFLPIAERLRLTPRLDLAAVALGLEELESKPQLTGLAINLSASSIQLPEFRDALGKLLRQHRSTSRLWLEISETGVLAHFDAFRTLCLDLKNVGCQMGIEHFGRQFSEIGRLHGLGLDYLKVDASFIRGLEENPGNQAFLKGLSTIAKGIGMKVIAEGVASEAEFKALREVGFDGATGPAIREIE
ncbi:MAG: EAL domain-containing protein [Zoogloeaceae bacterium]|nr:EAL domain-containing protein [Zoogloeaceae bacterium]